LFINLLIFDVGEGVPSQLVSDVHT